ncbi:MAG TPA: hypothetical protein VJA94_24330 [Candidatus Angelobacter sp.]
MHSNPYQFPFELQWVINEVANRRLYRALRLRLCNGAKRCEPDRQQDADRRHSHVVYSAWKTGKQIMDTLVIYDKD